jgi:PAS domain-containing protein
MFGSDRLISIYGMHVRVLLFVLSFIVVGAGTLYNGSWLSDHHLHTLMEAMSSVLAAFVGMMALVRYYTRRDIWFFAIGLGFIGTSFLDFYHTLVTSHSLKSLMPSSLPTLVPWSWFASRFLLSALLFLSWVLWRFNYKPSEGRKVFERLLISCTFLFTVIVGLFFVFVDLPPAYNRLGIVNRPSELLPFLFFAMTLWGYLLKGDWRSQAFDFWFVISLIVSLVVQGGYMANSSVLFDWGFDAAHVFKSVSYACVLIGLLVDTYQVFTAEMESKRVYSEGIKEAKREEKITIVESMNQGITLYDRQMKLIVCNRLFVELMNVDEKWGQQGTHISNLFRFGTPRQLDKILRGEPIRIRFDVEKGRTVDVVGEPKEVGYIITYLDVTDAVVAEREALRASKEFKNVLDSSLIGIGISGLDDDKIRWINKAGAELLGFVDKSAALGFAASQCWADPSQRVDFVSEFEETGKALAREVKFKCQFGGEGFWCYLSWTQITFEGQLCRLYWMIDITEHKRMQSQLSE